MSTFLELCQALGEATGIVDAGIPTTTVSQVGTSKDIVDWVNRAWRKIQNLHYHDWRFMHADFGEFTMTSGQDTYSANSLSITDFGEWDTTFMRVKENAADETVITFVPYEDFRLQYLYGSRPTGRPQYFTVAPDQSLVFGPKPDDAYKLNGSYFKAASDLSGDSDTPGLPAQFHDLILYEAMMLYAGHDNAPEIYLTAKDGRKTLLNAARRSQLPKPFQGGPLT